MKDTQALVAQAVEVKVVHTHSVQHLQDKELVGNQTLEVVEVDLITMDLSFHQVQAVLEL